MVTLHPRAPTYPPALRVLPRPPIVTASRPLPEGTPVAIVGTRRPTAEARSFAFELARAVATGGGVVVSGGAAGVDRAAHEGALAAGGRTVCVAGTGCDQVYPPDHAELFRRIAASDGAMVWPFPRERGAHRGGFLSRNGVLVALSSAVVVVQAGRGSGALNAAGWARRLGRTLWAVPQPPWAAKGFEGCLGELDRGARPVTTIPGLLAALGLGGAPATLPLPFERPRPSLDPACAAVLGALEGGPMHADDLVARVGLGPSDLATALLTLSLESVVEEEPLGCYRLVEK